MLTCTFTPETGSAKTSNCPRVWREPVDQNTIVEEVFGVGAATKGPLLKRGRRHVAQVLLTGSSLSDLRDETEEWEAFQGKTGTFVRSPDISLSGRCIEVRVPELNRGLTVMIEVEILES